MKGMFWVTRGGDVVESQEAFTGPTQVATCLRVGSNAFLGTRRLDKLRPANQHEVIDARMRWESKR